LLQVLRHELNVKEVRFLHGAEELVSLRATPNFRLLGKRFGGRTQDVARHIRALTSEQLQEFRRGGALRIELDGETVEVGAEEVEINEEARGELIVESDGGYTVALESTIDEALLLEGLARELVNRIQRLRRDRGFEVADRIRLSIRADDEVLRAVAAHRDYIAGETLAVAIAVATHDGEDASGTEVELDGRSVWISMSRE
jgi:isoleucyl-tRNA synthetase